MMSGRHILDETIECACVTEGLQSSIEIWQCRIMVGRQYSSMAGMAESKDGRSWMEVQKNGSLFFVKYGRMAV